MAGKVPGYGEAEQQEGKVGGGEDDELLPGAGLRGCPDEVVGADLVAGTEERVEVGAGDRLAGDAPGNQGSDGDQKRVAERQ